MFMHLRRELRKHGERNAPSTGGGNPFARLNRADIRAVAKRMDASGAFVAKLRDGQILSGTMTDGFMGHVVAVMDDVAGVPEELVYAHLAGEAQTAAASRQFYKAASGPEVSKQQTFEEAVRSSGLSAEQSVAWSRFRARPGGGGCSKLVDAGADPLDPSPVYQRFG